MKRGFVTNMDRCIGCNACVIACKQYHGLEPEMKRRKVREIDERIVGAPVRAYLSAACQHCDNPACMAVCPTGAYTKRADGVVLHNPEVCIGCRLCQWACPYEAPTFNPVTKKMDKCDFCRERIDSGQQPFCVDACPMEALSMVDMETVDTHAYTRDVKGFPRHDITNANLLVKLPSAVNQTRR